MRNFAVGAVTAVVVSRIERPIVTQLAVLAEKHAWGIAPHVPPRFRTAIAIALMDYTLYWWHVLLHRSPALWQLHEAHHADRDLDTSTAARFHFLEFIASVPWRCAQIAVIGVGPRALALWQKLTLAEVLFHHSNLRLPRVLERALAAFVVTPRLHGIHHSVVRAERDSNYSSGLTLWDRLHGSARLDFERDDVKIGLPEIGGPGEMTFVKTLAVPFRVSQDEAS